MVQAVRAVVAVLALTEGDQLRQVDEKQTQFMES